MSEKVCIICNLNCSRREMDMAKLGVYLQLNGYNLVRDEMIADYIVVTSCGFINETTKTVSYTHLTLPTNSRV